MSDGSTGTPTSVSSVCFEASIGLEVHVQLRTTSKIFCGCHYEFGAPANSQVCEICLGYPGALPVLNEEAVDLALKLAIALDAEVEESSHFDRKHYFYPDLPKGYQITQQEQPLAVGGRLPWAAGELTFARLHLEEDTGRMMHEPLATRAQDPQSPDLQSQDTSEDVTLLDFNRAGVALLEVVTHPTLRSSQQASDALRSLHRLLVYTGVSDGKMAEGSLRCDVNISLRKVGSKSLGPRVEIKNLNSFRHVSSALDFEIARQEQLLLDGGIVLPETRSWDPRGARTNRLRSKESKLDYRFLPEPDLPPIRVDDARLAALRCELPELPWSRQERFMIDYAVDSETASRLTAHPILADYVDEAAAAKGGSPSRIVKWIQNDVLRLWKQDALEVNELGNALPAASLASLISALERHEISSTAGKTVLEALWRQPEAASDPIATARRLGLVQINDLDTIDAWIVSVLESSQQQISLYRAGKKEVLGFFIGRVMSLSRGQAEPRVVAERLRLALEESSLGEKMLPETHR